MGLFIRVRAGSLPIAASLALALFALLALAPTVMAGVDQAAPTASIAAPAAPAAPDAPAAPAPKFDSGDTAWMLVSTALVLMMTVPGLALFYGGLVRNKNVLSTFMHSFFCAALVGVLWVMVGYTLAFGPSLGGYIGGFEHAGLTSILPAVGGHSAPAHPLAPTIPHMLFVAYQMTFAIITPALISGAFAERMRFSAFVWIMALWSLLIYAPLAHWVWGGGWIGTKIGAIDFAGGTVVHISSGISALVCAIYLGKRHGYPQEAMPPNNLPFTVMGAGLLWVGWFGFNAGSALASNELTSIAMVNTNTAAAAGALSWMMSERFAGRKPTMLGAASGAVAGLVVITPAAGFVSPASAIAMGLIGGAVCYLAVSVKPRLGYDDALDVVGVHFVGGTLGALLTGVFASAHINPAIAALTAGGDASAPTSLTGPLTGGLLSAGPALLGSQAIAVLVTIVFAGLGTWLILAAVNLFTRVRAHIKDETLGLDLSQHSERAYVIGGGEGVAAAVLFEPRSASAPPVGGQRFDVVIDNADAARIEDRWRTLCRQSTIDGQPSHAGLNAIYPSLLTVRGNVFRFRSPNGASPETPERVRAELERLFANLDAKARLVTR